VRLSHPACNAPASTRHTWPAWIYSIFPHYLINGTTFEKMLLHTKVVFRFPLQHLFETFLILRKTERDVMENVYWSSGKVTVILVRFWWKLNLLDSFFFFEKYANTKLQENPSSGNRVVPCGRTDKTLLILAFRNFATAPKNARSSQPPPLWEPEISHRLWI
jgi:hypothetical protein